MYRVRERISLRWQLAIMYVVSLSAVLALLGLLLYREVDGILVSSVYHQLQADTGPILNSGQLQAPAPQTFPTKAIAGTKQAGRMYYVSTGPGRLSDACIPVSGPCAPGVPVNPKEATQPKPAPPPEKNVTLDRLVATDVAARFIDGQGATLGEAGSPTLLPLLMDSSNERTMMLARQQRLTQYIVGSRPSRVAVLVEPATTPQGVAGVLVLGASLGQVDLFLAIFRMSLIVGIIAALGTGTAVGLWMTRRFLEPLDRMTAVSKTVAAGDLRGRFRGPAGSQEVRTLAHSYNHMIDRLEASLSSQRQFTADAAHELRTPLTSIGGSVELLLLGADGGEPELSQKMLRAMDLELQRLTRLVNDLLQLSRMEGEPQVERCQIDVAELTTDVAHELRLIGPHVQVETEVAGPLLVLGDHDRLKQVLLNVGHNALKFTPRGGTITLDARRVGSEARIRVMDTGPGIAAADLPHIFDRFYRSDRSRSRSSGGMGLGLAIARAIVEAHHGAIAASSAPGDGATLTIDLPLYGALRSSRASATHMSPTILALPVHAATRRRLRRTGQPV